MRRHFHGHGQRTRVPHAGQLALEGRGLGRRALAREGTYHAGPPPVGLEDAGQEGARRRLTVRPGYAYDPHGPGRVVPKRRRHWPQGETHGGDLHLRHGEVEGTFAQDGNGTSIDSVSGEVVAVGPVTWHAGEQRARARLPGREDYVSDLGVSNLGVSNLGVSNLGASYLGVS